MSLIVTICSQNANADCLVGGGVTKVGCGRMTVDELVRALASDDVADRRRAAEAAVQDSELAATAGVPLLDALTDEDEQVRDLITSALEDCGEVEADPLVLLERLSMPDDSVAYWAATLLGRLGERALGVAGEMRAAKATASPTVKARIERMLIRIEGRDG